MSADPLIPINIVIADRTYRIKVSTTDEENVRATVKLVNDKLIEFKTNFAGKDMQDYIAMVLIWLATEQQGRNNTVSADNEWQQNMNKLEQMLDKALAE
jgi:cell division protein ZapA (FtsZ GTPase activity inhibitor)